LAVRQFNDHGYVETRMVWLHWSRQELQR